MALLPGAISAKASERPLTDETFLRIMIYCIFFISGRWGNENEAIRINESRVNLGNLKNGDILFVVNDGWRRGEFWLKKRIFIFNDDKCPAALSNWRWISMLMEGWGKLLKLCQFSCRPYIALKRIAFTSVVQNK